QRPGNAEPAGDPARPVRAPRRYGPAAELSAAGLAAHPDGPDLRQLARQRRIGPRGVTTKKEPRTGLGSWDGQITTIGAPFGTLSCRSIMSWNKSRTQPLDTALPMVTTSIVPCTRYSVSRLPWWI